jgi:hypothetical protein
MGSERKMSRGIGRREGDVWRRSQYGSSDIPDPDPLSGYRTHSYDAANGGIIARDAPVSTWPDYGSNPVVQATGGNQPTQDSTDSDFGTAGQSVIFDGTDDYVVSASSIESLAACTWAVVFRTGATGALRSIFSVGTALGAGAMDFRITAGSNLIWVSWDNGVAQSGKFFAGAANTVYKVIAVWVPTIGSYAWTLYNNGVATGTDNGSTVVTPANQTGVMRIGQNSALAQPWNGKVRLINRYNIAANASQVAALNTYLTALIA